MLEALYQKKIIDLARQGRQRSALDYPELTARLDNPLCGDRVTIDLTLESDLIKTIGVKVRGCALCEAASEVLAIHSLGLTFLELRQTESELRDYLSGSSVTAPWPQLSLFHPVKEVPSRHECVLLPFVAIEKAFSSNQT